MSGIKEWFMQFVQDFIAIFLVPGMEPQWEQVVKLCAMGMILVLMLGLISLVLRFMTNIVRPLIEVLGQRPDYLLFAVIAALLLLFTSPVNFLSACAALLIFVSIFVGLKLYQLQYAPHTLEQGPIWTMGGPRTDDPNAQPGAAEEGDGSADPDRDLEAREGAA